MTDMSGLNTRRMYVLDINSSIGPFGKRWKPHTSVTPKVENKIMANSPRLMKRRKKLDKTSNHGFRHVIAAGT